MKTKKFFIVTALIAILGISTIAVKLFTPSLTDVYGNSYTILDVENCKKSSTGVYICFNS